MVKKTAFLVLLKWVAICLLLNTAFISTAQSPAPPPQPNQKPNQKPAGVSPEKKAELDKILASKEELVKSCAKTVSLKKVNVTISITVGPGTKTSDLKITAEGEKKKELEACIQGKIGAMNFPDVGDNIAEVKRAYNFEEKEVPKK